jgi:hypothetical protein
MHTVVSKNHHLLGVQADENELVPRQTTGGAPGISRSSWRSDCGRGSKLDCFQWGFATRRTRIRRRGECAIICGGPPRYKHLIVMASRHSITTTGSLYIRAVSSVPWTLRRKRPFRAVPVGNRVKKTVEETLRINCLRWHVSNKGDKRAPASSWHVISTQKPATNRMSRQNCNNSFSIFLDKE